MHLRSCKLFFSGILIFLILAHSNCFLQYLPKIKDEKTDKYTWTLNFLNSTINNHVDFKHNAYNATAYLVDTFGPRLLGSPNLELSLEYLKNLLVIEGFQNVKLEKFDLKQRWVRGKEKLTLLDPRPFPSTIPMIGLGKSVGGNVTAELILMHSFEELEEKGNAGELKNKIAFFNFNWTNYGENKKFRTNAPSLAAKHGAVGCIIRSVASKSIENPHTGAVQYDKNFTRIPAAAVSIETADMFERMIRRNQTVRVNLYMEAKFEEGNFQSGNLIGELTGSKFPNEIILLGGHIDSWDVGPQTGANDDAGGVMVCYEAIRVLIKSGLRPLRTLRFIAWTGEEFGDELRGATYYPQVHKEEMENHILAFESDLGTTDLFGFGYTGGAKGFNLVKMVADIFFKDFGMHTMERNGVMADTRPLNKNHNIPVMKNLVKDTKDNQYYFTYHHSAGDSMNVLNPDFMDRNVFGIAGMMYIIADVPWKLPKD